MQPETVIFLLVAGQVVLLYFIIRFAVLHALRTHDKGRKGS